MVGGRISTCQLLFQGLELKEQEEEEEEEKGRCMYEEKRG